MNSMVIVCSVLAVICALVIVDVNATCDVYVGASSVKKEEGCEMCWVNPEYLKCENGEWKSTFCKPGYKCKEDNCKVSCIVAPAKPAETKPAEEKPTDNKSAEAPKSGEQPAATTPKTL